MVTQAGVTSVTVAWFLTTEVYTEISSEKIDKIKRTAEWNGKREVKKKKGPDTNSNGSHDGTMEYNGMEHLFKIFQASIYAVDHPERFII